MERILWIGNPFFVNKLAEAGWKTVFSHYFEGMTTFTYDDLVRLAGFAPDCLVVADKSIPPFVLGVEDMPCLTVFYAVDSHLQSWYPYYAQAFDLCLLSLKDHIPLFANAMLPDDRIIWSPPYAQDAFRPKEKSPEKEWDCLFVGPVNTRTPKRKVFLDELKGLFPPLHVQWGNFVELFPKAKVVLNYCEHGDLNFRVFEALGLGSALVTPRIANGQDMLFKEGIHFLLFDPEKPGDCLKAILHLLEDDSHRVSLGKNGLKAIDEAHRASHRALSFTEHLRKLWPDRKEIIAQRRAKAPFIRKNFLRLPYLLWAKEIKDDTIRGRYLAYAQNTPPKQTAS
ncbi:MAG: glycosyltransferase family 1 protein [Desulfovibrio sp.]|nr:glycosyltransferase family 1 protein [Desulfovibrio sp.]